MPRFIATGIHERTKSVGPVGKKSGGKVKANDNPVGVCKYRFLVMQRFGDDLQKKLNQFDSRFDLKTSYTIARKVIDILEYIHSFGYIHADTKASNLLLGRSLAPSPRGKGLAEQQGFQSEVWLVDFGLVEKYKDSEGNHKSCEEDMRRANNGTVEFTSRDAHIGALSRRSDLEILAFNILSWLSGGRLPWMGNLKDHKYVHSCKKYYMDRLHDLFNYAFANPKCPPPSPPPKEVFGAPEPVLTESERKKEKELITPKGAFDKTRLMVPVPPGLQEFFQYIVKLDFQQDPDYDLLKTILHRAIIKSGHSYDGRFSFQPVKDSSLGVKKGTAGRGKKHLEMELEEERLADGRAHRGNGREEPKELRNHHRDRVGNGKEEKGKNREEGKAGRKRKEDIVEKVIASKLKKSVLASPRDRSISPDPDRKKGGKSKGRTSSSDSNGSPIRGQLKITDFFRSTNNSPVNKKKSSHPNHHHVLSSTAEKKSSHPNHRHVPSSTAGISSMEGEDLIADIVDRVARGAGRPGYKSPKIVKTRSPTATTPTKSTVNGRSRMDASPSSPGPRNVARTGTGDSRSKSVSPARKRSTSVSAPTSITPNKKLLLNGSSPGTPNGQSSGQPKSPFNNPTPAMLELMARLKEKRKNQMNGIKNGSSAADPTVVKGRAHSPTRLFTTSVTGNRKVKPSKRIGRLPKHRSKSPVKSDSETPVEEVEEEEDPILIPSKKAPRSRSKVAARSVPKSALSSTSSTHSTKENKNVHGTRRSPRVR